MESVFYFALILGLKSWRRVTCHSILKDQ